MIHGNIQHHSSSNLELPLTGYCWSAFSSAHEASLNRTMAIPRTGLGSPREALPEPLALDEYSVILPTLRRNAKRALPIRPRTSVPGAMRTTLLRVR